MPARRSWPRSLATLRAIAAPAVVRRTDASDSTSDAGSAKSSSPVASADAATTPRPIPGICASRTEATRAPLRDSQRRKPASALSASAARPAGGTSRAPAASGLAAAAALVERAKIAYAAIAAASRTTATATAVVERPAPGAGARRVSLRLPRHRLRRRRSSRQRARHESSSCRCILVRATRVGSGPPATTGRARGLRGRLLEERAHEQLLKRQLTQREFALEQEHRRLDLFEYLVSFNGAGGEARRRRALSRAPRRKAGQAILFAVRGDVLRRHRERARRHFCVVSLGDVGDVGNVSRRRSWSQL